MPRRKKTLTYLQRDHPDAIEIIEDMAAQCAREVDIAAALGTSWGTFNRIRSESDEVAQAMQRGSAKAHHQLVSRLYQKAMDGDTIALLFLLKTRFGYREASPSSIRAMSA